MSAELRQQLQADVSAALRARDKVKASVLRTTLTAVANAEAVDAAHTQAGVGLYANEAARRQLTDAEIRTLITVERDGLRESAAEMRALGQDDEATRLATQADILTGYLDGDRV